MSGLPRANDGASGRPQGDEGTLTSLLETVSEAGADPEKIKVSEIAEAIGALGFAPLLIVPSAIVVTPASAIPGLSTVAGLTMALIAGQALFGRTAPWLPGWIRRRSIDRQKLQSAIRAVGAPTRWIDRITRRRLPMLTGAIASRVLLSICTLLGLIMPLFEFIPTSSSILSGVILLISLSILTRDGLIALAGLALLGGAGMLGFMLLKLF
ncbi:exopolysaccharide biosynthesis protein [Arsenicitalea aurantiaca]|nr:exopolysaccharide biosynthesis protein [Arsenicitalea aurantiaca]